MSGGRYNSVFLAGLIQDPVSVTIRAAGERASHRMRSMNTFLKGTIKLN
jgi:hypothetical protein